MRNNLGRFFDSNAQTQAVIHAVLSLTLLIAGLALFFYGSLVEARTPLLQTVPLNFVVIVTFFGIYLYSSTLRNSLKAPIRIVSGVIISLSGIDGWWGGTSLYVDIDTGFQTLLYALYLALFACLLLEQKWPLAQRFQLVVGLGTVSVTFVIYLIHFLAEQPVLTKHPSGSMIVTILTLIIGVLVANYGWRQQSSWSAVAQRTLSISTFALVFLMILSVSLFRSEMLNIQQQGARTLESANTARILISNAAINMLQRVTSRWERYPTAEQGALIEADVERQVNDVSYLKSIILLDGENRLKWESVQDNLPSQQYLLDVNPSLISTLASQPPSELESYQFFVSEPSYSPAGMLLIIRLPIAIKELDGNPTAKSILAVIDVVEMMAMQSSVIEQPITSFIQYFDKYWVDQAGHWLLPAQRHQLERHAILLYQTDVPGVSADVTLPMQAYLTDVSSLQRTANLQSTIIFGGILMILFLALVLERNRSIVLQGKQLKFQAEHDTLTGLLNRNSFERRLAHQFRHHQDLTVLFIDLDGFTLVNDSLGLQVGDRLLQLLAARLTHCLGPDASLARFSSDEFICLLQGYENQSKRLTAINQAILEVVAQPYRIMQHKIYITASIGVAQRTPEIQSPFELVQRADMAMHEAKNLGNNHVQFYQQKMSTDFSSSALMRSELQEAIENDNLTLYYQPIVSCADSQIASYEALLRWQRSNGEFVSPLDFIPLAEKTGQIIPLSEWVFREACTAAVALQAKRQQQHLAPVKISVNLSTMQFNRAYFVDFVLATFEQTGCQPQWLELELTESILLENMEHALNVLKRLREAGISIALDDFGTGFSSLSYLKRLPVDKVKIDRSFIQGIGKHKSDTLLIESVIKIAQSLDFAVTAEGIETAEQAEFVTRLGCNYMQGYLFGRPDPNFQ